MSFSGYFHLGPVSIGTEQDRGTKNESKELDGAGWSKPVGGFSSSLSLAGSTFGFYTPILLGYIETGQQRGEKAISKRVGVSIVDNCHTST